MGAELQGILKELEQNKEFTEDIRQKLGKLYGTKFTKALDLVISMAVKKYVFKPSGRTVWIVVGREKEYFIIPDAYCQCDDFYINVVIRRRVGTCYHIVAQQLAEKSGKYETFEALDSDFIRLNVEWKKQNV